MWVLEKIRFSITRLKQHAQWVSHAFQKNSWKDKILDYEIETCLLWCQRLGVDTPWKDKILDYEIETIYNMEVSEWNVCSLEKIRFSITRLKLGRSHSLWSRFFHPWKDKILDYEIETCIAFLCQSEWLPFLEKIRFSITRLKQLIGMWKTMTIYVAWKDKILDYEIETNPHPPHHGCRYRTSWKDKILDYEIETYFSCSRWWRIGTHLKR